MAIELIAKIAPKNAGFTGMVDADQVLGGSNLPATVGHTEWDAAYTALHNAVTLQADLEANLLALSTQVLDLNTQAAGTFLGGPVSGAAAKPSCRAIAASDIQALACTWSAAHTFEAGLVVSAGQGITTADGVWIGNSATTARLGFNSSAATNYALFSDCFLGIGAAGNAARGINHSVTTTLTATFYGHYSSTIVNPTGATANIALGFRFGASNISNNNMTATQGIRGVQGEVGNSGTGTVTGATSFFSSVFASATPGAGQSITSARHYYAATPTLSGGGTIGSVYGIYIAGQNIAGVTAGWGIYQVGGSDKNYFAGPVGIGTTATVAPLQMVGTLGAFIAEDAEADVTDKVGRWGIQHRLIVEEPFYGIVHYAGDGVNSLRLGGSTGSGNAATEIKFYTAANSTTLIGTQQAMIDNAGNVVINAASALGKLHADNVGTVAQPVLYLDQGDVSEEMIEFTTTIGVGNAIEAVGSKTLTTTHFIKVTLPGALTRYIPVGTIA